MWDEQKHPRDKNGQFTSGNGGSAPTKEEAQKMTAGELKNRLATKTKAKQEPKTVVPKFSIIEGHYSCYASLTKKERAEWFTAIGEIKRGMWVPSFNGLSIIQIGKKIVLTDPNYDAPSIKQIMQFSSTALADRWIERIFNEQRKK